MTLTKEKLNKVFASVKDFVESDWFIWFTGLSVAFCSMLNLYMVGFCIGGLSMCLVFFTNIRMRACLPPLLMIVFNLSSQKSTYIGVMDIAKTGNIIIFAILGVGVVSGLIYAFIKKKLKVRFTLNVWGVVCMCVAMTFGGIFSPIYSFGSMLAGALLTIFFLGCILLFGTFVTKEDFPYIAKIIMTASLVVCAELFHLYAWNAELRTTFNKSLVLLGFGISNSAGCMIIVGLPFTAYFMATEKKSGIYCLILAVQMLGVIFTFSRASLLLAVPCAIACCVYACFRNKKWGRYQILIFAGIVLIAGFSLITTKWEQFAKAMSFYIENGFNDSGRTDIWGHGIRRFLTSPITGVGFVDRVEQDYFHSDLIKWFHILLYHNNVIQFLVVGGIIGLGLYAAHNVIMGITCLTSPNERRSFAMVGLLMLIGNSMLDIVFFYPYSAFMYTLLIAFMDADLNAQNDMNARLLKSI